MARRSPRGDRQASCHVHLQSFGIDPFRNKVGDASYYLSGVRFVFIDEYSFVNCRHLAQISESIRKAFNIVEGSGTSFSDVNIVLCGDLCQHTPVQGLPCSPTTTSVLHTMLLRRTGLLAAGCPMVDWASKPEAFTGLAAYRKFDRVVFLMQQQRIALADDELFANSRLFMSDSRPSRAVVAKFCDELNAKVVTPALLEQWAADGGIPRVVCLRNEIRKTLNWSLASLHAKHSKARPIVWFNRDTMALGERLSGDLSNVTPLPQLIRDAVKCMKPEDTKLVPAVQIFFPGCLYTFNENPAPGMGYVNNSECVGVGVLLAADEEDDPQHSCWILKRPPLALYVRPAIAKVRAESRRSMQECSPLPAGCVPVCPAWTDQFNVRFRSATV